MCFLYCLITNICFSEEKKKPSKTKLAEDPLNWFGLMAPTSLVQAQTRFKSAIERIVEITNLKQELQESLSDFETLTRDLQKKCDIKPDETNED